VKAALVLATCITATPPPPVAQTVPPPPPARSSWQDKCAAAMEQLDRDAGAIVPTLRTAEIHTDRPDYVSVSAFPPVWKVNLSIQITRKAGTASDWQAFNEYLHVSNHFVWVRRSATVEVAILLDGWTLDDAARIEPVLRAGVEPCLL